MRVRFFSLLLLLGLALAVPASAQNVVRIDRLQLHGNLQSVVPGGVWVYTYGRNLFLPLPPGSAVRIRGVAVDPARIPLGTEIDVALPPFEARILGVSSGFVTVQTPYMAGQPLILPVGALTSQARAVIDDDDDRRRNRGRHKGWDKRDD